jgi:hypothetical protein
MTKLGVWEVNDRKQLRQPGFTFGAGNQRCFSSLKPYMLQRSLQTQGASSWPVVKVSESGGSAGLRSHLSRLLVHPRPLVLADRAAGGVHPAARRAAARGGGRRGHPLPRAAPLPTRDPQHTLAPIRRPHGAHPPRPRHVMLRHAAQRRAPCHDGRVHGHLRASRTQFDNW